MDDVLVHDAHEKDITMHLMLSLMGGDMPIALGIIRQVEAPSYDGAVEEQIAEVQAKNPTRTLHDLLMQGDVWTVR
jgi:2-oxoglutarate ferredoxin oxidoreductase subunit beta